MDIHGYPRKNDMDMDMDMDGIFLIHGKPAYFTERNGPTLYVIYILNHSGGIKISLLNTV